MSVFFFINLFNIKIIKKRKININNFVDKKSVIKKKDILILPSLHLFSSLYSFVFFKFINNIMFNGKKDKAISIFKSILYYFSLKFKYDNVCKLLISIFSNLNFVLNVKKKKVAGRTHHIPLFLNKTQQILFGLKNFVVCCRTRIERNIILKILAELLLLHNKDLNSMVMKKKKALYLQAIENKFYAKFL